MGLLESSYESADPGALAPPADWLRRPAAGGGTSRQRWPAARARCRSRSLQRRRVVSMFWGPRPPEPAGRSRSAEGDRQQLDGDDAADSDTPAHGHNGGPPPGPARSAPVTPTVVIGRGAPETPAIGESPPDAQYRQTLRRLTGDIDGLLRRAEAVGEDGELGDGVVDGDGMVQGGVAVQNDRSLNCDDECAAGENTDECDHHSLTMGDGLARTTDDECSDTSDSPLLAGCNSRTLPCKLPPHAPATVTSWSADSAGAPGVTCSGEVGGERHAARSALADTQRVPLASCQDGSVRGHNTPGTAPDTDASDTAALDTPVDAPETPETAASDDGDDVAAAGDHGLAAAAPPEGEEEVLFEDSAEDVLLMLMDSLPEPVTQPVGGGEEVDPLQPPLPRAEEMASREPPECPVEPECRRAGEERKPLSVIVVTTVIDSTNDEGVASPDGQLQQEEDEEQRTLKRPPDVGPPPLPGDAVCCEDLPSDAVLTEHSLVNPDLVKCEPGAVETVLDRVGDSVSADDIAVSVDAAAAVFPRACDVDDGGPLCLLAGPVPEPWSQPEEPGHDDPDCSTIRFVPGLSGRSDCSYTCHQRCRDLVTLDCPSDTSSELDLSEVTDPNQDEDLVEVQTLVRCDNVAVAEVRETDSRLKAEMIEKYNATSHGLYMTLSEDGQSFHGFIRVHMNLFRPINIVAGARPPSIYDVLQPEQTLERTLASFYLPRDTVKALHIDNDTTVQEVISSLLKKFKIVDDPRKFALYERLTEQGESTKVKMRRLADSERPLELALSWSHHGVVNKKFVLQENDTGDILWDNFTLPELNNFLTMLNKEEEDYKRRVRQKYTEMKRRIAEQMDQLRPPGGAQTAAAAGAE